MAASKGCGYENLRLSILLREEQKSEQQRWSEKMPSQWSVTHLDFFQMLNEKKKNYLQLLKRNEVIILRVHKSPFEFFLIHSHEALRVSSKPRQPSILCSLSLPPWRLKRTPMSNGNANAKETQGCSFYFALLIFFLTRELWIWGT
jgi:hypothetical protein